MVGEFENQDKAEEAYNITQNLLTSHPNIKGIYVTAGGPFGAAKAIKDAGLTGKVKLVCHDWMAETVAYVRSGEVTAVLDQDPFNQGYARSFPLSTSSPPRSTRRRSTGSREMSRHLRTSTRRFPPQSNRHFESGQRLVRCPVIYAALR